ncbi:pilus assembly protein [Noviherbaspirillum pedocola]|uniref:Pilus assembly protein n=1 Tax=Noviherbaspirillum pedocola TaxID=2801341 RepID=A0A934SNQ6_9BURK|nr:pilus assembly protein [Noviherbaspirillum pedocola]MBK4733815.1 pilus assembly protein [Noviherbaspirillum pedocola]
MSRRLFTLTPLCLLIAGCVQPAPVLDSHLGDAVTMLKAQQIINPEAGRNPDPVAGIDGKAGKSGYDQYQKSYRAQEPQTNVFTIGIGR